MIMQPPRRRRSSPRRPRARSAARSSWRPRPSSHSNAYDEGRSAQLLHVGPLRRRGAHDRAPARLHRGAGLCEEWQAPRDLPRRPRPSGSRRSSASPSSTRTGEVMNATSTTQIDRDEQELRVVQWLQRSYRRAAAVDAAASASSLPPDCGRCASPAPSVASEPNSRTA
jgi:hypothetical protein